jgi:hypothetical protein
MENLSDINLLWWISVFELPAMAALFGMIIYNQRQTEKSILNIHNFVDGNIVKIKESLSSYKLEVAKNYASLSYLNAVEKRLTEHLLRIENKLDRKGK